MRVDASHLAQSSALESPAKITATPDKRFAGLGLTRCPAFETLALAASPGHSCWAFQCVPKWRNWQTRMVQVHVLARVWGFESLLRHQITGNSPSITIKKSQEVENHLLADKLTIISVSRCSGRICFQPKNANGRHRRRESHPAIIPV